MEMQKWIRTAQEARRRLSSGGNRIGTRDGNQRRSARLPGKGRLAQVHEIALDLGIAGPTLRNYLNALSALESIPEPGTARLLSRFSAVGVMAFYRWWRRDPWSAEEFLHANPHASLAQLLAAEGDDRLRGRHRHNGRQRPELDDALLARLSPGALISQALGELSEVRLGPDAVITEILPPQYKFAGLDRLIVPSPNRSSETVAPMTVPGAIILPKLAVLDDYARRGREFWWRACSASALCPLVLVVFPGPAARRRFLSALPQSQGAGEGIFSGLPEAPRSGRGTGSSPIFFRTGPGNGLIVISSTLTLERDIAF